MSKSLQRAGEVLEFLAAFLVMVAIVVSGLGFLTDVEVYSKLFHDISYFRQFLEEIFTLVVGIEFLQMLCKPDSDNVLEALIFLVARHMILGESGAVASFLSVCSVILLVVLRRFLHNAKMERAKHEHDAEAGVAPAEPKKKSIFQSIEDHL